MPVHARHGASLHPDPVQAVAELADGIGREGLDAVLFFCSSAYDLDVLGRELERTFPCPVVGCTSAGQIGPGGFQLGGLAGASLAGGGVRVRPYLIQPLSESQAIAMMIGDTVHRFSESAAADHRLFGVLLVDGLSKIEERLAAALYQALGNVPIVGGSAGDDLRFERTSVYHEGQFLSDAAVFTAFEATTSFRTFKLQHFVPSPTRLVITEADPEQRIIHEIDGSPAAQRYAEAIGVPIEALNTHVFSRHPLMLRIADDYFVRSIQRLNPDMSLTCFCAIDSGLVVAIGSAVDAPGVLEHMFQAVRRDVPEPALVIGCDSILRRLELEHYEQDRVVGEFLARNRVLGFSTYGEQFNGMHVNQTFTGVAIGA
jgi:hypothetical protein